MYGGPFYFLFRLKIATESDGVRNTIVNESDYNYLCIMRISSTILKAGVLFIALTTLLLASPKPDPDFCLNCLEGTWSGEGEVIIPNIRFPLSIEGNATFAYDSAGGYLRTAIEGRKFYFTYSDSGHLYYHPETDSITWEIWDGFGEYGIYYGEIKDGMLQGTLSKDKWLFHIKVDFVANDTIQFHMTTQKGFEGNEKPQATIDLWRMK